VKQEPVVNGRRGGSVSIWRSRFIGVQDVNRAALHFWIAVCLLVVLMTIAVIFYMTVESRLSNIYWSSSDSLYQAVLVLTTVGSKEVHGLSQAGQIFTSAFALTGVILVALAVRSAASLVLGQQLSLRAQQRRRLRALNEMRDHFIVCGYGRMGRETVRQLRRRGYSAVVIDEDSEALQGLEESGVPFVQGNATEDEHLRAAGIDRARCLVAAVGRDEDNLFVVLSARLLNPHLYIVARAGREGTADKLERAGANSVHSPYVEGGRDLAYAAVHPGVVQFLEEVLHREELDVDIVSLAVPEGSPVIGEPMLGCGIMQEGGAMILGLISADGKLRTNPRPQTAVQAGDTLIAMGTRRQLEALDEAVKV
jgi:voltage-gated potassium channel